MTLTYDRILLAAAHSKPSQAQLTDWTKRDEENARVNAYGHTHPCKTPRTALTGWTGRTIDPENVQWAPAYAEPGYTDTAHGILFANWNGVSRRVQDILERAGMQLNGRMSGPPVRSVETQFGHRLIAMAGNNRFGCRMTRESFSALTALTLAEYLASLENKTRHCSTLRNIDPADHGYIKLQGDFENGFHPGQNDDPKVIYKELRANGEQRPLIFVLDSTSQFDIGFSVWKKQDDAEETR